MKISKIAHMTNSEAFSVSFFDFRNPKKTNAKTSITASVMKKFRYVNPRIMRKVYFSSDIS